MWNIKPKYAQDNQGYLGVYKFFTPYKMQGFRRRVVRKKLRKYITCSQKYCSLVNIDKYIHVHNENCKVQNKKHCILLTFENLHFGLTIQKQIWKPVCCDLPRYFYWGIIQNTDIEPLSQNYLSQTGILEACFNRCQLPV